MFHVKLRKKISPLWELIFFLSFVVRRKGMSKPPVKLGVDKSYLIEKERTS